MKRARANLEALVLGRVAQRGNDLAVSAELVRVRDNRQIWGERYQRTAADIFTIQEDLAQEISEALKVQLSTDEESRLTRQYTVSSEAYDAYLRGRYHWNRRTEESLRQAVEHFQDAIREDPSYALAYSALADTYSLFGWYYEPPTESYPKARAAAERALEIDDSLGEAHASRAYVKYFYEWDFAGAERGFLRAIELSPSYAAARQWYASNLAVRRRYDEAIQQVRVAIEVDPLSLVVNSDYGLWLVYSGQYEDGVEQLDKTLELQPDWAWAHVGLGHSYELQGLYAEAIPHYEKASELSGAPFGLGFLGHAYAKSGRLDDAHAILQRLEALSRKQYLSPVETAYVHAGLGDLDATFEWLEKAHDERASALVWVFTFPISLDLAADPRFSDLKRRVGLEP